MMQHTATTGASPRRKYPRDDDAASRIPVRQNSPGAASHGAAGALGGMAIAYSSPLAAETHTIPADAATASSRKLQELRNAIELLKTPPALKQEFPFDKRDFVSSSADLLAQMKRLNQEPARAMRPITTPTYEPASSPASISLRSSLAGSSDNLKTFNRCPSFLSSDAIDSQGHSSPSSSDTDDDSHDAERTAEINEILARIGEANTSVLHCSGPDTSFSVSTPHNPPPPFIQHPISSIPGTPQAAKPPAKSPLGLASPGGSMLSSAEDMKRQLDATRSAFYRALEEQQSMGRNRSDAPPAASSPLADLKLLGRASSKSLSGSSLARIPVSFDDLSDEQDTDEATEPETASFPPTASPPTPPRTRSQLADLQEEIDYSLQQPDDVPSRILLSAALLMGISVVLAYFWREGEALSIVGGVINWVINGYVDDGVAHDTMPI